LPKVLYFATRDALESKSRLFSEWLMVLYLPLPRTNKGGAHTPLPELIYSPSPSKEWGYSPSLSKGGGIRG